MDQADTVRHAFIDYLISIDPKLGDTAKSSAQARGRAAALAELILSQFDEETKARVFGIKSEEFYRK